MTETFQSQTSRCATQQPAIEFALQTRAYVSHAANAFCSIEHKYDVIYCRRLSRDIIIIISSVCARLCGIKIGASAPQTGVFDAPRIASASSSALTAFCNIIMNGETPRTQRTRFSTSKNTARLLLLRLPPLQGMGKCACDRDRTIVSKAMRTIANRSPPPLVCVRCLRGRTRYRFSLITQCRAARTIYCEFVW